MRKQERKKEDYYLILNDTLSKTRLEMPKVDDYAMNRLLYKDEV